jgi:hypothetical protein
MQPVSRVLEDLGPTLVVGARGELDRLVRTVVVTDPAHPTALPDQSLVVGVGLDADGCGELLRSAREARASAVLVKGHAVPEVAADGPAVVVVDPAADWGHVIALTRMSLNAVPTLGEGEADTMFHVAEAVAGLCGGSVVIHDAAWQMIAYAGGDDEPDPIRTATLLGRRAPQEPVARLREAGVVDRLLKGEIVHVAADEIEGLGERYAAAILVGGQMFGSIWVMPHAGLAEKDAREGLRRGVEVAALALLRRASFSASIKPDHDADFAALLNGVHTERLVAQRLNAAVDGGFVLAGLRPLSDDPIERAATVRRLVGMALSYCEAYRVTALTAPARDTAFLIFPCTTPEDRPRAVRVLTELHGRLRGSAAHRAMISSTFRQLSETVSVRSVVEELLDLAERRGWSGLTDSESVQASWRLAQFRELALAHPALLEGPARRLVEHDTMHGSGLIETLRAYFDAVGDVKEAGNRLQLHANTVRYRLRRVEEVAGISLDDPDERLLAELQVRLLVE